MRNGKDVDPELMKKMNEKLSHRGPDGSAIWCDGPMGLGHQMLWTTQESLHEKLPLEENNLVITADARIDNRDELSKELGLRDEEDVSDSYFILKSYEIWGEECPDKLRGDFAFAIWDKAQEKLFCARDHMGVKPFYYYLDDDMFVFSTEIKAFFTIDAIPQELNEKKVALYLVNLRDQKFTFYKDIFSLIGANSLTVDKNKQIMRKYWELNPNSQIIMDTDEDYINAFNEIFGEAVQCRLRSAYPVGFELSGGLDSSSVVCMAKKIFNEKKDSYSNNLKTFSIIYDGFPEGDERHYIEKVVNKSGIEPHFITAGNQSLFLKMENILWYLEQPFFTPFMSYIWDFYQKMQKNNIRVILGGAGGDEVLDVGNYYINNYLRSFKLKSLIKTTFNVLKHYDLYQQKFLLKMFISTLIPKFIKNKIISQNKESNFFPFANILNKDFLNRNGGYEYLKNIYNDYYGEFLTNRTTKTFQKFNINSLAHNKYAPISSASISGFSIEHRYPYLDKRLLEFCFAIPTEIKARYGWDKYILRIAMENILPPQIQWRTDKGRTDQVLYKNFLLYDKKRLDNLIYNENPIIRNLVDLETVKECYKKYQNGTTGMNLIQLWFISLLFLWLQKNEIFSKNKTV